MKIGFYGNANNYPFMLARALRRLGHETLFLVSSRDALNRPEYRYSDIRQPYPDWIVDVSHRLRWHALIPGPARRRIVQLLNSCDFVILNEEGPALSALLRRPHAALLTGSDLEVFANPLLAQTLKAQLFSRPPWLQRLAPKILPAWVLNRWLVSPQRRGIRQAGFVASLAKGLVPRSDRLLSEIGVPDERRLPLLMTDADYIPFSAASQNAALRVFCATRLTWRKESETGLISLDYKGSDTMVRGFALFYARTGTRLDIHLVRKGRHVVETARLAESLGIADQITWHDEMTQARILEEFRRADVVIEQLADATLGMAGLDAMATGRPVIGNGRPEVLEPIIGTRLPVCQARTPEQVAHHLGILAASPQARADIGADSRRCIIDFFSSDAAARSFIERIRTLTPDSI